MFARLTAYLPDGAAVETLLRSPQSGQVGRIPPADLVIAHPSVSRRHATFDPGPGGWVLRDLDSKNGTFADGARIAEATLTLTTWLRFGDVHCEFRPIDADELGRASRRTSERRNLSQVRTAHAERQQALPDLLRETLAAVVDLSNCERGFLLLEGDDGLVVRATQGIDTAVLTRPVFGGSVGAVERALHERRPVVVNDAVRDARFSGRASVVAGGLRTLVCVPLLLGDEVLGLVYADSQRAGSLVTTLDLELLKAFAERAALWIAARRGETALAALPGAIPWAGIAAAHAGNRHVGP
jgi:putative methionine-R-sulfoxide reductase with GAF domain